MCIAVLCCGRREAVLPALQPPLATAASGPGQRQVLQDCYSCRVELQVSSTYKNGGRARQRAALKQICFMASGVVIQIRKEPEAA